MEECNVKEELMKLSIDELIEMLQENIQKYKNDITPIDILMTNNEDNVFGYVKI